MGCTCGGWGRPGCCRRHSSRTEPVAAYVVASTETYIWRDARSIYIYGRMQHMHKQRDIRRCGKPSVCRWLLQGELYTCAHASDVMHPKVPCLCAVRHTLRSSLLRSRCSWGCPYGAAAVAVGWSSGQHTGPSDGEIQVHAAEQVQTTVCEGSAVTDADSN